MVWKSLPCGPHRKLPVLSHEAHLEPQTGESRLRGRCRGLWAEEIRPRGARAVGLGASRAPRCSPQPCLSCDNSSSKKSSVSLSATVEMRSVPGLTLLLSHMQKTAGRLSEPSMWTPQSFRVPSGTAPNSASHPSLGSVLALSLRCFLTWYLC